MNENYQKIQQIFEALRLSTQTPNPANPMQYTIEYQITGEQRTTLINELVRLLTIA